MKNIFTLEKRSIFVLIFFLLVLLFVNAFLSSQRNELHWKLRRELEPHKKKLINEISELEVEKAQLTSIDQIQKIAIQLGMSLPDKPAQILDLGGKK